MPNSSSGSPKLYYTQWADDDEMMIMKVGIVIATDATGPEGFSEMV